MDYKVTVMSEQVKCNKNGASNLPVPFFGVLPDGTKVLDMTAYNAENGTQKIDRQAFCRLCKNQIEGLINEGVAQRGKLFFLNTDGHELVCYDLAFLFLSLVDSSVLAYFHQMLDECLTSGIAFSDAFITSMASQRIPTDILQQIIDSRKDGDGE